MLSGAEMSIPGEIRDFFQIEKGQTLLIKGLPGTGKTTLALEIMNSLCEDRNGMYISTRVDPRRLYAINPWIKEVLRPKNVVNATQTKLLESLKGMGKDLSNYYAVLDFFKVFFDETEEMDNPMIIIDSWDAVLNYTAHLIGESQHSFEQNICEFARDLDTHLIFVSEFANVMPLDYIVDGVVTMEQFRLPGYAKGSMRTRYVRQIKLDKLRGVEIGQKTYTVTLHEGRFRFFKPYREHKDALIASDGVRVPDLSKDRISTGIPDLDTVTGGLKYGSCNVLEIDHGVGKRYYQILTALASNAIKNGRGVFILPSLGYQLSSSRHLCAHKRHRLPAGGRGSGGLGKRSAAEVGCIEGENGPAHTEHHRPGRHRIRLRLQSSSQPDQPDDTQMEGDERYQSARGEERPGEHKHGHPYGRHLFPRQ